MRDERLARRWGRRHARWVTDLAVLLRHSRSRGAPEDVHQLRVTLRRLRLSLRLAKKCFGKEQIDRLRSWGAKVSQVTSSIRDLDIAVEWLRACKIDPALVQECQRRRQSLWRRRRRHLKVLPARLASELAKVRGAKAGPALEQGQRKLEARYRDDLRRALPRFFEISEDDRHEFRRVVRRWRYLRELVLPKRKQSKDDLLAALTSAQEAIGELQNLALVAAALKDLTPSAELAELHPLLARQQAAQRQAAKHALRVLKVRLRLEPV